MANKKSNKISIRPIGNAQAIASTLGIGNLQQPEQKAPAAKTDIANRRNSNPKDTIESDAVVGENETAKSENLELKNEYDLSAAPEKKFYAAPQIIAKMVSLPLMFEIKRRLPGKELFVLSLLYKKKNERGMLQTTVNELMSLYYSVFDDTIKDDTVRRSLKRLADAALIQTKSIPGHNAGYVYEVSDLLETDIFATEEKEEFTELLGFVESKLNAGGA